jgi:SAM-dependent methyltransferase
VDGAPAQCPPEVAVSQRPIGGGPFRELKSEDRIRGLHAGEISRVRVTRMAPGATTRQAREQEFYDREYASAVSRAPNKYYSIADEAREAFRRRIENIALGDEVLEYGCGPRNWAPFLASRGARVTGIDISPVAIETAKRDAAEQGVSDRVSFAVMDAERLDFDDRRFDLICGVGILHHLDLAQAYRELSRALKASGRAVFLEPMGHNPLIRLYRWRTPEYRTEDEHPLLVSDLTAAREHFARVRANYFHLLALGAVPLRNTRVFGPVERGLHAVDDFLLERIPRLRKHAWMVVLEMADPKTH